jgi:hypothetical protein
MQEIQLALKGSGWGKRTCFPIFLDMEFRLFAVSQRVVDISKRVTQTIHNRKYLEHIGQTIDYRIEH